jgi:hypothetical protein
MGQNQAAYVTGEQYRIAKSRYDVSVYRIDAEYYATWFCDNCPTRGETPKVGDQAAALDAGIKAAHGHHEERHAGI